MVYMTGSQCEKMYTWWWWWWRQMIMRWWCCCCCCCGYLLQEPFRLFFFRIHLEFTHWASDTHIWIYELQLLLMLPMLRRFNDSGTKHTCAKLRENSSISFSYMQWMWKTDCSHTVKCAHTCERAYKHPYNSPFDMLDHTLGILCWKLNTNVVDLAMRMKRKKERTDARLCVREKES